MSLRAAGPGTAAMLPPIRNTSGSSSGPGSRRESSSMAMGGEMDAAASTAHSRLASMEVRLEHSERAARALLEETVRLQAEMSAVSRRYEGELENERKNRSQMAEDMRRMHTELADLRLQFQHNRPELQSTRDATMGSLQQARQLEHRVLSSQQDALLWRNDISVRIEQLRQDLEAAKHHQRHRDEAVDANANHVQSLLEEMHAQIHKQQALSTDRAQTLEARCAKLDAALAANTDATNSLLQRFATHHADSTTYNAGMESWRKHTDSELQTLHTRLTSMAREDEERYRTLGNQFTQLDTAFGEQRQQTRAALNDALALVEQLKALQASDITKLMEGLQKTAEVHAGRLVALELGMRQEIQQATAKAQSQVETERRQRRADADQLRADVQQMVQAAEVRLAAQLDGQQGAIRSAKAEVATSMARLAESVSLIERQSSQACTKLEKVVQMEIISRQQGQTKINATLEDVQQKQTAAQARLVTITEEMGTASKALHLGIKTELDKALTEQSSSIGRSMADLESRFETMVGRMAAVQEASKIQQAALSTLPNRMDVLQQDQRQKHNELSARIDEDLHGMGQELALIKMALARKLDAQEHGRLMETMQVHADASASTARDAAASVDKLRRLIETEIDRLQQSLQSQHKACSTSRDTLHADVTKLRRAQERLAQQCTTQLLQLQPGDGQLSRKSRSSLQRSSTPTSSVDPKSISYDPTAPAVDPYDWVGEHARKGSTATAPRLSAASGRVPTPPAAPVGTVSRRQSRPSLADVPENAEEQAGSDDRGVVDLQRSRSLTGENLQALARAATETAMDAAVKDLAKSSRPASSIRSPEPPTVEPPVEAEDGRLIVATMD